MAKKAAKKTGAAAIESIEDSPTGTAHVTAPTKAGKGKKLCVHCGKAIAARSSTCPECGKAIPPKAKMATGRKRGRKAAGGAIGGNGIAGRGAIEALGFEIGHGIRVNSVVDDALKFIHSSGGIKNARTFLDFAERFGAK